MNLTTAFRRNTLGYGLITPFRRTASSDFLAAEGEPLVSSSLEQILGTRPGELRWRPDFGIDLERYRHKNNSPALGQQLAQEEAEAISAWEPRVQLISVSASISAAEPGDPFARNVVTTRVNWAVTTGAMSPENNVLIGPVSQEIVS